MRTKTCVVARGGGKTSDILAMLRKMKPRSYSDVVIHVGTNDTSTKFPKDKIIQNMSNIIDRAKTIAATHSVESPSTVDPQWDIWYWGSKWNLHTVCWSAVGCEWGTTSVYFGITYVCFIPSRLPVFAVEPQYLLQDFLFLSKIKNFIWRTHTKSSKKFHVGLKFEWGLWDQYWLSCERLAFEVFLSCLFDGPLGIAYANMLATTQWPLERAANLTSVVWVCVLWLPESLTGLSALWVQLP